MEDFSFGIIPIFVWEDDTKVLLICNKNWKYWSFPKWHKEVWEDDLQTSVREFQEETGVFDFVVDPNMFFLTNYSFTLNDEIINKTVKYFFAEVWDLDVNAQKSEIVDYAWLSFDNAIKKLSYDNDKKMFAEFVEYYWKR